MSIDIFEFWSQVEWKDIRGKMKCHPRDREVLARMDKHHFDLACLPLPFDGPLKTAPVVLLFLSPGLDVESDHREANTLAGRKRYMARRGGEGRLPGPDEPGWKWWKSHTSCFGADREPLRTKIAILNIGAYHSTTFGDRPLLASLPSSRVSIDWAQNVLFPQAIAGERIAICLRSPEYWGLYAGECGRKHGRSLYAPCVTRSGHMRADKKAVKMRDEIIRTVKTAIGRG